VSDPSDPGTPFDASAGGAAFLYPFIESEERDAGPLLGDLAASARAKAVLSKRLAAATIEAMGGAISAAARAMAERFEAGGVLYTFGNGGSSSDAASVAALFSRPPSGRPLPARCLTEDPAILTALGNDVGFELVFARQLIAHARAGDMCIALSTSGGSKNLLVAVDEGRKRGVLNVAMAGYDGGTLARSPSVDHSLVVRSDSVHRIQESQAALAMELWRTVQLELTRKAA
jgi:D-sedoheptulose 7-phosphate isomerase